MCTDCRKLHDRLRVMSHELYMLKKTLNRERNKRIHATRENNRIRRNLVKMEKRMKHEEKPI